MVAKLTNSWEAVWDRCSPGAASCNFSFLFQLVKYLSKLARDLHYMQKGLDPRSKTGLNRRVCQLRKNVRVPESIVI
jgi:hypothetical protein